jgi:uncharacterized protein (DUF1330 family)/ribosomal protein S18 acetylase RimI-like enzyme
MTAYWVNTFLEVRDTERLNEYAVLAGPAMLAHGGRFLARGTPAAQFEQGRAQRVSVIEFPSVEAAVAAYHSPAYQAALELLGDAAERDIRIMPAAVEEPVRRPGRTDEWHIEPAGPQDVERFRPLWLAAHERHRRAAPELAPYLGDDESWSVRRRHYGAMIEDPGAAAALAVDGDHHVVGYVVGLVLRTDDTWVDDTWATGPLVGEVESLAVQESWRGRGIGSALLGWVERRLAEYGAHDVVIGVVPGNDQAERLYRAHGYRPAFTYLARFTGRDTPGPAGSRPEPAAPPDPHADPAPGSPP